MANKIFYRYALSLLVACVVFGALPALHDGEPAAQERVESSVCLDCHEGQDATLAATAHALREDGKSSGVQVACMDCHGANSKHWEEGPAENPMIKPAKLDPAAEAKVCSTCHNTTHQQNMLEKNVHAASEINCSGCHSVHASHGNAKLLKKEQPALCYDCHGSVEGDFTRSYRHPVNDGVMDCTECHMTLDDTRHDLSFNGTNVCASCHPGFEGPFPYEHQATLDYATEEGGCLNCHSAHGTDNPMMLKQPYEPPHFQLCTQCHGIPAGHNSNFNHGTQWQGQACYTCHTDIHGSYDNRYFLRESLRAEGCLNPACHGH